MGVSAEKRNMQTNQIREQVDLIREVFNYIHRFKDSTFVIRLNSRLLDHPLFPQLISDLALLHENGIHILIVPGAREQIDRILENYGIPVESENGIRISSEEAMTFIKMAAFDVCNRVMTHLTARDKSSLIGNWVKARALGVVDGVDFQYTGKISRVQTESITKSLNEGYIPIFPCIGWNSSGDAYNISSDELAVSLSTALGSRKLFFIEYSTVLTEADLILPEDLQREEEGRISKLTIEKADALLKLNPGKPNMRVIHQALRAARGGVDRVHIVNGTLEGVVLKEIFSNLGIGTMVFANIYESIRPMEERDISGVLSIINPLAREGILIPRSRKDLEEQYPDYVVYAVDDIIHAAAALHPFEDGQGEIAGLAVDPSYVKLQIGQRLVQYLIEQGRSRGMQQIFVLTTQTSDWFLKLGFTLGQVEDLPLAKRENYNRDRNSRILIFPL